MGIEMLVLFNCLDKRFPAVHGTLAAHVYARPSVRG